MTFKKNPCREWSIGWMKWLGWASSAILAICLLIFVVGTWHWPLVGDSSIIHYVAFLMARGFAPYRQIVELNMPGAYLVEWLLIHIFGGGSLGWRVFDLVLTGSIGLAMIILTKPYGWFAGFVSWVLLTLIHGQDGVAFLGERDLIIAALLIWSCTFLFLGLRHDSRAVAWAGGFAAGIAGTMKPLAIPVGFLLLVLLVVRLKSQHRPWMRLFCWCAAGLLLPYAIVAAYLLHVHSLIAFVHSMLGLSRYYNGLYRKPLGFLLLHSISPLGPLAVLWIAVIVMQRDWNWEKRVLAGGAVVGLIFYLVQGRGFPYYRYPLLAFLTTLMSIDFLAALHHRKLRSLAMLAAAYVLLWVAPRSVLKAVRYDWRNQEFITMLGGDLRELGGQQLSGKVQCFDTIAGCINTLYRAGIVQATGFLYDCYAYAPRGEEMMWMVQQYRRDFLDALRSNPPAVLVVSNQYCQAGPDSYDKLKRWPELANLIENQYRLYADRMPPHDVYWWSRPLKPSGYRIYLRK